MNINTSIPLSIFQYLSATSLHGNFSSATVIFGTIRVNTVDADQMAQICLLVYVLTLSANPD